MDKRVEQVYLIRHLSQTSHDIKAYQNPADGGTYDIRIVDIVTADLLYLGDMLAKTDIEVKSVEEIQKIIGYTNRIVHFFSGQGLPDILDYARRGFKKDQTPEEIEEVNRKFMTIINFIYPINKMLMIEKAEGKWVSFVRQWLPLEAIPIYYKEAGNNRGRYFEKITENQKSEFKKKQYLSTYQENTFVSLKPNANTKGRTRAITDYITKDKEVSLWTYKGVDLITMVQTRPSEAVLGDKNQIKISFVKELGE